MIADTGNDDSLIPLEDIRTAIQEGRSLRPAHLYRITVLNDQLHERHLDLNDPVPTGRQILHVAGLQPVEEYSVYAVLPSGEFEDLRLDETYDLRGLGAERFILLQTDRAFKFTVDNRQMEWGTPLISGLIVRRLAAVGTGHTLYLEVRGGQDREVNDTDIIDLSKPGVERFITVIKETTEGLTALPAMDRVYLEAHAIEHEILSDGNQVGVILKSFPLPINKYDHSETDLLIFLPSGYPDACPDMFFTHPWVKLTDGNRNPSCADVQHVFGEKQWQRWSRHCGDWRPGVDGLHTMIARARHAIEQAR